MATIITDATTQVEFYDSGGEKIHIPATISYSEISIEKPPPIEMTAFNSPTKYIDSGPSKISMNLTLNTTNMVDLSKLLEQVDKATLQGRNRKVELDHMQYTTISTTVPIFDGRNDTTTCWIQNDYRHDVNFYIESASFIDYDANIDKDLEDLLDGQILIL